MPKMVSNYKSAQTEEEQTYHGDRSMKLITPIPISYRQLLKKGNVHGNNAYIHDMSVSLVFVDGKPAAKWYCHGCDVAYLLKIDAYQRKDGTWKRRNRNLRRSKSFETLKEVG